MISNKLYSFSPVKRNGSGIIIPDSYGANDFIISRADVNNLAGVIKPIPFSAACWDKKLGGKAPNPATKLVVFPDNLGVEEYTIIFQTASIIITNGNGGTAAVNCKPVEEWPVQYVKQEDSVFLSPSSPAYNASPSYKRVRPTP